MNPEQNTDAATPVVFISGGLQPADVVGLMDELIGWWSDRPKGVGRRGGTAHLHWVRDTFRTASVVSPPQPDEPTGLGAVVEDVMGRSWTRTNTEPDDPDHWYHVDAGWDDWIGVRAVKVLSEGVSA